jgi:flagellar protein FliO/FliZ
VNRVMADAPWHAALALAARALATRASILGVLAAPILIAPGVVLGAEGLSAPGAGGPNLPVNSSLYVDIILALAVVVAIIVGGAWLVRRTGISPVGGAQVQVRVLGAVSVGQRERVVLVQVGSSQVLLGVTAGQISALQPLDSPIEDVVQDGSVPSPDGRFAAVLGNSIRALRT